MNLILTKANFSKIFGKGILWYVNNTTVFHLYNAPMTGSYVSLFISGMYLFTF